MNKVYKYGPVTSNFYCVVSGRIVSVGIQNGQIYVWAEQTPIEFAASNYEDERKVKFVPTGCEYEGECVGTVFEAGGALVWHVIQETQ
jgi:hypothetical protein